MKNKPVKNRLIITIFLLLFLSSIPLSSQIIAHSPFSSMVSYTVQRGDTLSKISQIFGVSQDQIAAANQIQNRNLIWVGQQLNLPTSAEAEVPAPTIAPSPEPIEPAAPLPVNTKQHSVRWGESLISIAQQHGVSLNAVRSANPGISNLLHVGQTLNIPDFPDGTLPGLGEIFWPVEGRAVVKGYFNGHRAIDIVVPTGSPIQSMGDGTVTFAGWTNVGYGNMVMIDHGNDMYTLYAHLSELYVETGNTVGRHQIIGLSGNTGRSSMPHLHLEIRDGGTMINPCLYLEGGC
ncbi:MAG: M23 family metallopeptidase [Chloroflexota bacterium]